jgi:hypothetical protein
MEKNNENELMESSQFRFFCETCRDKGAWTAEAAANSGKARHGQSFPNHDVIIEQRQTKQRQQLKETTESTALHAVKMFQGNQPLEAGDCIMVGPADRNGPYHGPLVTIESNSNASLKGWGRSTDDDDTWHIRILFLDANQREIWSHPPAGGRMEHKMDHPNNWYLIENFFTIHPDVYNAIQYVRFEAEA